MAHELFGSFRRARTVTVCHACAQTENSMERSSSVQMEELLWRLWCPELGIVFTVPHVATVKSRRFVHAWIVCVDFDQDIVQHSFAEEGL